MSFQQRELQTDEAYVILLTELEQLKPSEQYCVVYPHNADINLNFVHIAHFFPKVYVWMNYALDVCGLSKMTVSIQYSMIIIYAEILKKKSIEWASVLGFNPFRWASLS